MVQDRDQDAPSLEPPRLFGRRKKRTPATAPAEPVEDAAPTDQPAPVAPSAADRPPAESDPITVAPPEPAPVAPPGAAPPADDCPATILDDVGEPTPSPKPEPEPVPTPVARPAPSEPRPPREPWLEGRPAAVLTGLVVGALIVAATAGSLRICTAVQGTSSCGGPGFFLLVAILLGAVLVGAALLKAAAVPQPGSTSFLAVGLLSVMALLFLVGSIFEWWMIIVVPLVSVATFLLSHWVTTTYIEPEDDAADASRSAEKHDVR